MAKSRKPQQKLLPALREANANKISTNTVAHAASCSLLKMKRLTVSQHVFLLLGDFFHLPPTKVLPSVSVGHHQFLIATFRFCSMLVVMEMQLLPTQP